MTDWFPLLGPASALVQTVIAAIFTYAASLLRDMRKDIRDVRDELRILNGRVIKMETWKDIHDEADAVKHETMSARLDRLERRRA